MSDESLLPVKLEPVVALVSERVPKMMAARDNSMKAMDEFLSRFKPAFDEFVRDAESKDDFEPLFEEGNALLSKIKTTADKLEALRKEMTSPLDELKEYLMQFEKDLAYDAKAKTKYNEIKSIMFSFKQAQVAAKAKKEEEAARKREIENYKVDLSSQMRTSLVNYLSDRIARADDESRKFFESATLDVWEKKVEAYMSFKPKMKEDDYNACFKIPYDSKKISQSEFDALVEKLKETESYDVWNNKVIEAILPIMNQWRAKIPEIKAQKLAVQRASEEEKQKLIEAQKKQSEAEAERIRMENEQKIQEEQAKIAREASLSKMSNNFVEQGTVQKLDPVGPTKKVIKFSDDPMLQSKAILAIIYNVMLLPKFPGIYAIDKNGQIVVDGKGIPEYHSLIKSWVSLFEKYCKDQQVEGIEWVDEAKVIIKR